MKARIWGVLAGVVVLGLLAVTLTACGDSKKATAAVSPYASPTEPQVGTVVVTTVAGRGGVQGSTDGSGAAASFSLPAGIACDAAGSLYVADSGNHTVRKITPAGKVTTVAGKSGSFGSADGSGVVARFYFPQGIACDAAGYLYVTDANGTIRKITPAGKVTTLAGQAGSHGIADGRGAAARFASLGGVACDAAGNLYVVDTGGSTIRKITPAGRVTTLAGSAGTLGSADGSGAAASFSLPADIACDAGGNLYVTDGNNTIRKITPTGEVTTLAGQAGSFGSADGIGSVARFTFPQGIACDGAGYLYVADEDGTIRKITPAGKVTTLAGQADSPGVADGNGAAARFSNPTGITCDAAGNLYVADSANNTIRKITLSK